jgi:excisionase family DNA binding protein
MVRELKTYTLEEVSEILHLTIRTLYTYIKTGQLRAVKFGKYWRVSQEDLEAFMDIGTPNAKKTGPRAASK